MKRLILAVFAILLFTTTPWAQTPAPRPATLTRVGWHTSKHRAHAHRHRTMRHRTRQRHSA
jgi:hypothetical protein